jgi:hypothetical protein
LIFALSKALHRLIMSVFLKNSLLCLSVTAALSLTACGGSGGSSASDAPTSTIAPSYELVGNVLSVTNSGIIDADGVTDLLYVLKNSAGQEVARQNSPRFADLAAGSYTLSSEGRAKNGATGASVAVVNLASVAVTIAAADPAPTAPAGSAFAGLGDMTVSDNVGNGIRPINAGGVIDPLGRAIRYSATGLPAGLSIDRDTGVISGVYDSNADAGESEKFNITIIATPATSTKSLSKPFVLSIRNDG